MNDTTEMNVRSRIGFAERTVGLVCGVLDAVNAEAGPDEPGAVCFSHAPDAAGLRRTLADLWDIYPAHAQGLSRLHGVSAEPCAHGPVCDVSWHGVALGVARWVLADSSGGGLCERRLDEVLPLGDGLRVRLVRELFAAGGLGTEIEPHSRLLRPLPAVARRRWSEAELMAELREWADGAVALATVRRVRESVERDGAPVTSGYSRRVLAAMRAVCDEASPRAHAMRRLGVGIERLLSATARRGDGLVHGDAEPGEPAPTVSTVAPEYAFNAGAFAA